MSWRVKDTTREPAESANMGPWDLQSLGHQPASRRWTWTPYPFVADVQRGLHLGPLTSGAGAVSLSLSLPLIFLVGPQWVGENVLGLKEEGRVQ